jgi:hypothetical protein
VRTYLPASLAVRLLVRPPRPGHAFDPQWVSTIGIDLLAFSTLQFLQAGGLYYAPLFALPVLTAAVLGRRCWPWAPRPASRCCCWPTPGCSRCSCRATWRRASCRPA